MNGGGEIILANFDEMDEIATELGRAYANLTGELADLESDLKILETWDGAAKDVYLTAKSEWNSAVVAMGDTMQRFGPALHDATQIMRDAEHANMRRWGT
ncbi:WXG100 family type VII secretion target [Nonomuraea sp. KC401]|uniref:ESAT-6-like protein n=1 Tax=Nonomuraea longispora TaxID=1848320 RepID=A0A4R4MI58_9ACTN|nr:MULTISPECIES: WXG100 family type VII secretion target [Nonomuraea]NBE97394.1 WXG100 family type VII secretion target [Nonomuraea sp. K271]TDB93742.1 WXG100 family type VII secretion target [Nonomuraea longispora]TLF47374.1 WXG100 family type VII secretion target [Nonomuraea sp. KC401]